MALQDFASIWGFDIDDHRNELRRRVEQQLQWAGWGSFKHEGWTHTDDKDYNDAVDLVCECAEGYQ